MVDIRFPIGLMFTILGVLITIFGFVTMSNPKCTGISGHQCEYHYGYSHADIRTDNAVPWQ